MKHAMKLALGAALLAAAPAAGQTIAQGMTPSQVRAEFGAPATAREAGDWTYWYYHNGCPRRCGSDDVVFFQNDRVVAAVLRTSRRHYRGPQADDALQARDDGTSAVRVDGGEPAGTVIVGGVRVEGGPPADAERGTPVPAREGRPGEAPTIVIGEGEPQPGSTVTPATAPAAGAGTRTPAATGTAPARNTEAADLNGQTSIDRAAERERRERQNKETATERARRNDQRGNP